MHAPATLSDHFLADHRRLEALLGRVHSALEANDRGLASRLWAECRSRLTTHLDAEERDLIPSLLRRSERDARVLVHEHRHIRSRMTELDAEMASPRMRADVVRGFADEFHAHCQCEERLLYRWADARVDEPSRAAAIAALGSSINAAGTKPE